MDRDQRRLDRLLSGSPDLSVHEKEAMLRALVQPRDERRVWASPWLWVSAVTAAIAVIVIPLTLRDRDEFASRGGGLVHGSFSIVCADACRTGDTIRFDLAPPEGAHWFAAAALRNDGLLVWYFPDDNGASLRVDHAGVAASGIVIGEEQEPGEYQVYATFSPAPLTRDQLKHAIEADPTSLLQMPLEVVRR